MDTLAQRLLFAMKNNKVTQKELADRIGVTNTAIAKITNGQTLNPKYILELANALNVDVQWLKNGKGEQPSFSQAVENIDTEEKEKHQLRVEVLDVYASAGNGSFLTGDLAGDICAIEFENEYFMQSFQRANEKGLAIINVTGDSMEPTLQNGDLLYVDVRKNYYCGDGIYVFSLGDTLYVKRLQLTGNKLLIHSDNKFYDTWDIHPEDEEQFIIHGKVEFQQGKIKRVG
jgi:hypothetical protein